MYRIKQFIKTHPDILSRRNLVIVILAVIGVTLFLSVYDGVREHADLSALDTPVRAWAVANYNPTVSSIMRLVTDASSPISLGIISIIGAAAWAWRKKDLWRPSLFVGAMTVAYILAGIIKTLTARQRPTVTDLLHSNAAISYSFPSGHTVGIAVLLLVLSYFFFSAAPTARRFIALTIVAILGVSVVAFSRIYLGYHWLTDVTASVGLALIVLAIVIAVDTFAPATWRRRHATSKVA